MATVSYKKKHFFFTKKSKKFYIKKSTPRGCDSLCVTASTDPNSPPPDSIHAYLRCPAGSARGGWDAGERHGGETTHQST